MQFLCTALYERHAIINVITMIRTPKVMCEKALCESLKVENAADVWSLAELHSATQLQSQALDFISRNADKVKATEGWKNMLRKSPTAALVADIAKQQVQTFGSLCAIYGWDLVVPGSLETLTSSRFVL